MRKTPLAIIASFGLGSLTASATELDLFLTWNDVMDEITVVPGAVISYEVSAFPPKLTGVYLSVSAVALADGSASEPVPTWQELRDTLANDSKPYSPRYMALRSACRSSGEESAQEILDIMGAWLSELEAAGIETIHSNEGLVDKRSLIGGFLQNCVAPVERVLKDQQPLLRLLERITVNNVLPGSGLKPFRAIARNPAPEEVRREILLSIIARRRPFGFDDALYPIFDPSTFPKLRELVRTSLESGQFNRLAVRILAHYGDREILPALRTWHARLLEEAPKQAHYTEVAIWRIEVQNPPSKLLEYIASTGGWVARPWAIERATELGLPKEGIRTAILAHADQIVPVGEKKRRPGLLEIKRVGLELGILREDDLPDVKVPDRRPAP